MLNVATLSFVPMFIEDEFVGVSIFLCLYNPFSGNSKVRSPEFMCLNFTSSDIESNLIEMEKFQKSRIENLQEFPLPIYIFEYDMKSIAVYDENGNISRFTYPDGELATSIAKFMNFTPVYLPLEGNSRYGYQLPNGSFTGGLAASEYGIADLVANPKLIANYNTSKSVFLQPITMTKLFFIIRKRVTLKHLIITVFNELDSVSRLIVVALAFIFPAAYNAINLAERHVMQDKTRTDIVRNFFYIVAIQNCISMKHSKFVASRIIVSTVLFYTLMSTSLLQGCIVKNLNTNQNIGRITKIDQLFDQKFKIRMQPVLTYAFQGQGEDKITRELNKITRNFDEISATSEVAIEMLKVDDKFAYLWTDAATGNYLDRYYNNETGENILEVVPESAFEFYIALMAPKASPFIDRFNQIINIYTQTGLYQHHTEQAAHDNTKIWIHRVKHGLVPTRKSPSLSLKDVKDCFALYLALIGLACGVFCLEIFFKFLINN